MLDQAIGEAVYLVCPKCNKQDEQVIAEGWNECLCSKCKQDYKCLIARVRAKRSRGDKKRNRREYSVRLLYDGVEELLEFSASGYHDFELRSGDTVGFISRNGLIYVAHNFSINRFQIMRTDTPWLLVVIVFAIVIGVLVLISHR